MSINLYFNKLFKPGVIREVFDVGTSLQFAVTLVWKLLIHNNKGKGSFFKLKQYDWVGFFTGLTRIFLSPILCVCIALLCFIYTIHSMGNSFGYLLDGEFKQAFKELTLQLMGMVFGIIYIIPHIFLCPVLNLVQFLVRSGFTLFKLPYNWYHRYNEAPGFFPITPEETLAQEIFYEHFYHKRLTAHIPVKDLINLIMEYGQALLPLDFFKKSLNEFQMLYSALYYGETTLFKRKPKIFDGMSFSNIKTYAKAHPNSRTAKTLTIFHDQLLEHKPTFPAVHQYCQSHSGLFSTRFFPIGNKNHDINKLDGARSRLIFKHLPDTLSTSIN
ncbi:MAG: hypothetical protein H0U75_05320 [Legionella sp.]|nr:hypothetical protein [Legionella sp.]